MTPHDPTSAPPPAAAAELPDRTKGPGRLILFLYAVFVIGTVSRAAFQISTKWHEAPLAYSLSAFAAVVYIVAATSLVVKGERAWWVSVVAIVIELLGVLVVGTWSMLFPAEFPDDTVWSLYGRGYLFLPLLLPVAALWWLWVNRPATVAPPRAR